MHSFKDANGKAWEININVATVRRLRGSVLKLDLMALVEDKCKPLAKLIGDPCDLVDVLYLLCQEQADKLGITDEDFGRALGGDSLEQAANAFYEEYIDFFPDAKVRANLRKMLTKVKEIGTILNQGMDKKLDEIDAAIAAEAIQKMSMDSLTSAPASSDSTPDPSPLANSSA